MKRNSERVPAKNSTHIEMKTSVLKRVRVEYPAEATWRKHGGNS
jgi:hypothetical protein